MNLQPKQKIKIAYTLLNIYTYAGFMKNLINKL